MKLCLNLVVCGRPPEIENGYPDIPVMPETMDVDKTITYKCNPGYSFPSDGAEARVVKCMVGSSYSFLENCQRKWACRV